MAKKITIVISQGQSANPLKRKLEEDLVGELLMERGVEVTVVPHLYDLAPGGTGVLCLQSIPGDIIVLSWLYPRAAHWILDRNDVRGKFGQSLLAVSESEEEDEEEDTDEAADEKARVLDSRPLPDRTIYCVDLRAKDTTQPYLEEIRRIRAEASVQTVSLMGWIGGAPRADQLERFIEPAAGNVASLASVPATNGFATPFTNGTNGSAKELGSEEKAIEEPSPVELAPVRVIEETGRRWYPVIDFSRCTNCMECIDFCLFGVYGVDRAETILVEQPDNCRKGCPACSRVCPENAIIFPQHKTPAIAGSPDGNAGGLKIDLSKLFGAPDAMQVAALERDVELVAVGRDAVGMTVGIPKRQSKKPTEAKDDLDALMDELDQMEL
jgi:NAD-dependent dihydropyrimidine dehydrogenase PreA subunit